MISPDILTLVGRTVVFFLCADVKEGRKEREKEMTGINEIIQNLDTTTTTLFSFFFFQSSWNAGDSGVYRAPCNESSILKNSDSGSIHL